MKLISKKSILIAAACFAGVAMAVVWGPLYMSQYDPRVRSFDDDKSGEFIAASNIARFYMNLQVGKIKAGDHIRIVYPDGKIYDFETSSQCKPTGAISCPIKTWSRRAALDSAAPRSPLQIEEDRRMARDTCKQQPYTYTYKTGYWQVTYPASSDGSVITDGRWVSTGDDITLSRGTGGCK